VTELQHDAAVRHSDAERRPPRIYWRNLLSAPEQVFCAALEYKFALADFVQRRNGSNVSEFRAGIHRIAAVNLRLRFFLGGIAMSESGSAVG